MDEIDFKPESGWGWFVLWSAMNAALGYVMYEEWISNTEGFNTWGDRIGMVFVVSFAILMFYVVCLQLIFNPRRFSFTETGFRVWTWRGPRYVPWHTVTRATLGKFSFGRTGSWVDVTVLMNQGGAVSIPIELFKRRGSLLYELKRWLPVPLLDPRDLASGLVNE